MNQRPIQQRRPWWLQGQALVEFSLILPTLLFLTLGIIDYGRILLVYSNASSAIRDASRNATLLGEDNATSLPFYVSCATIIDQGNDILFANKALSYHQSSILLIKKGVPVHKVGEVSEKLFVSLGDACHIAQDRGSHREGTKGMGHDDQREKEEWWRADNPRDNGPGYEKAIENTKQLLTQWVTKRREIDKE